LFFTLPSWLLAPSPSFFSFLVSIVRVLAAFVFSSLPCAGNLRLVAVPFPDYVLCVLAKLEFFASAH
uniref:Uncharacterized protein n=1 Tax=Oryza brachyantha TaxID=4533 RepID=J3L0K4_ORYBR